MQTYKGVTEMLGRLALVTHWGMYVWVFILLAQELINNGFIRLVDKGIFLFTVPFILFTLIYWIIKKRWAFFPWQHVKPEE
jgi:hypothetical protein